MPLFTYQRDAYSNKRSSVISREMAEKLADAFEAAGGCPYTSAKGDYAFHNKVELPTGESRFSTPDYKRTVVVERFDRLHFSKPDLFALVDGLPDFWTCDVAQVLSERSSARYRTKLDAAIAALDTTPAIRAHLERVKAERGFRSPERCELRLKPIRDYKPTGACGAKLRAKEAVSFYYSQESYADHSRWLVPVDGGASAPACAANLSRWLEACRTHNGFAGSGCSYSATIHGDAAGGYYVEIDCRASISD